MPPIIKNNPSSSSSDSDYEVDEFIQPKRVRQSVNDDSADLLGNFDDAKRKEICDGTYQEPTWNSSDTEEEEEVVDDADDNSNDGSESKTQNTKQKYAKIEDDDEDSESNEESNDEDQNTDDDEPKEVNTNLTKEQLTSLMRGAAKANRHVLYVTNLNFETTREDLEACFGGAGTVKSVRIPKKRSGGFAFVEMADVEGFQRGFQLHNTEIQGRKIKVQISEAGKKKSANKKNIIKQKNRKLAEMRNEQKTFTKSGKFYDKTLKKEKAKEMLTRNRWRKKSVAAPRAPQ